MKKSTLALSIAAAIGGLGFAGAASAAGTTTVAQNGVGDRLIVPYFSAQSDNATLLNITNTDTVNGKIVKVRFRGAANSDDLFDFTLLMSPGDVWTATVSQGADGIAKLTTGDKSCTLPQSVSQPFSTFRLDPSASAADKANGTREGYVEIINMADISNDKYSAMAATAKATSLFKAVKHVSGVAPCTLAVFTEKLSTVTKIAATATAELASPSATLTANWIIMNQLNTAAWSGSAVALVADSAPAPASVLFPQVGESATSLVSANTADPLFTSGVVSAQLFDLPDLSTPYDGSANPADQADAITSALAVTQLANSYTTSDDIGAVTDFVFSQPTRRYHVAVNYTAKGTSGADAVATTSTKAVALYRGATTNGNANTGTAYYNAGNTAFEGTGRILCLNKITVPGRNALFDREETTPAAEVAADPQFTISPVVPGVVADNNVYFCGETNVISINNGGTVGESALSASVTRKDITFGAAYQAGWMRFDIPADSYASGLPILGGSFMRVNNGPVNYGFMFSHKTKAAAKNS